MVQALLQYHVGLASVFVNKILLCFETNDGLKIQFMMLRMISNVLSPKCCNFSFPYLSVVTLNEVKQCR
jgi:hypothetical protein